MVCACQNKPEEKPNLEGDYKNALKRILHSTLYGILITAKST